VKGVSLTRITDGVYGMDCHGRVWAYALASQRGVALIDTGFAPDAAPILDALAGAGVSPSQVRTIVATHCHADHVGSLAELLGCTGAQSIAHKLDAPIIRGEAAPPEPQLTAAERPIFDIVARDVAPAAAARVDLVVADGDELDLGEPARVVHAPGHTPGSIAIHLPERRLIFLGDAVASVNGAAVLGYFNADPTRATESLGRLAELDVEIACFGHGPPLTAGAGTALRAAAATHHD